MSKLAETLSAAAREHAAAKTAHRKPMAAPMTKAKRKPRKRTLQPRVAA
jgi:hypothetical protein